MVRATAFDAPRAPRAPLDTPPRAGADAELVRPGAGRPFGLGWPGLRHFSWAAPTSLAVLGAALGAFAAGRSVSVRGAVVGAAVGAVLGGAAMLGARALTAPRLPDDDEMRRASSSVVQLTAYRGLAMGVGSGWVAAPDIIITNQHVVGDRTALDVFTGDGRRLTGQVILADVATDVAVLRVDGLLLDALELEADPASGSDRYGILGYPGGGPFTYGAVTASRGFTPVRISGQDAASGYSFLDHSFEGPVAGGNSGGPIVDDDGHVVATVHRRAGSSTIYAIPNDVVRSALERAHVELAG